MLMVILLPVIFAFSNRFTAPRPTTDRLLSVAVFCTDAHMVAAMLAVDFPYL